jgi:2-desacetyl-2-hydroxyethyl bacteriochlorophyllide A dehydrogenase
MKHRTLYFSAPGQVEVREEPSPAPGPNEVLVQTELSAISAGTEMLVYRGQFPRDAAETFDAVSNRMNYPLAYGYACVGRVVQIGESVSRDWDKRAVFAFRPHSSHFVSDPSALLAIPNDISLEDAVFLPNMETAVNLVQDAAPLVGEAVLVLGQGIVGLLTSALLRDFPLACLITADRYEFRRMASLELGATKSLDPALSTFRRIVAQMTSGGGGCDLVIELSGDPAALNEAIALTRFSGRVVVGSWYGEKTAAIELGARYHRSRIRLLASQVSSISPELSGRWDKARRFEVVWNALRRCRPSKWITHRIPFDQAPQAYQLLEASPEQALQMIFTYA